MVTIRGDKIWTTIHWGKTMTYKKSLLVLSVSAGAGHVRAAEALVATAQQHYPDYEATHVDVMEYVPKLFRKNSKAQKMLKS